MRCAGLSLLRVAPEPAPATLSRRTLLLLSLTCGVAVGNLYFPQSISPLIATGLHVSGGSAALVVSAAQFGYAAGALGGAVGLAGLTVGTLLLDVAMQSGMVANQTRIFRLRPEVRSRINTAYMTCAFLGGSLGSWLGARAFVAFGWIGVCGLLALLALIALVRHLLHHARQRVR